METASVRNVHDKQETERTEARNEDDRHQPERLRGAGEALKELKLFDAMCGE